MNYFSEMLPLPQCHSVKQTVYTCRGAKLEAAVKFTRATVAYSGPDKPHLNNSHIALPLYLRVYPSETCAGVLIKLSDTTAPLLINNKLWALHCILAQILLTSPSDCKIYNRLCLCSKIDILKSFQPCLSCVCEIREKARARHATPWASSSMGVDCKLQILR